MYYIVSGFRIMFADTEIKTVLKHLEQLLSEESINALRFFSVLDSKVTELELTPC